MFGNAAYGSVVIYCHLKCTQSLLGSFLLKLPIILKNTSNKSCWKLNFLQKTQQAHMSISFRSRAGGSKDCHVSNIIMYYVCTYICKEYGPPTIQYLCSVATLVYSVFSWVCGGVRTKWTLCLVPARRCQAVHARLNQGIPCGLLWWPNNFVNF